ncbi:MAG: NAD(P)-dependent alcohol dehydrogenase [Anaerolineae bacterium]
MKAVVYTQYGTPDVLKVQEVSQPTPLDNEVLVRVHATPVNFGDLMARNFKAVSPQAFFMPLPLWLMARFAFGFNQPRKHILGNEFAGEIAAVGKTVTRFKVGEQVFGYRGQNMGANAEYLVMAEDGMLVSKPANMTYEEICAVPYGALTALSLLRKVNIQPGQKVLINGASGGIGSAALQLAKYFGAEVTGVCSTPRMGLVKSLGADKVIDYTREDFTQNGETYDLIFDVMGKSSFARCKHSLTANGRYLLASFKMKQLLQMLWTSKFGSKKVICALSNEKPEDLVLVKELVEAGKLKALVDRCYPMEQAAEAHRYMEAGARTGSVIISFAPQFSPVRTLS